MRLIDADEVINVLKETGIIQDNELGHCVVAEINRMPTAYDVDKVLEQLEYSRVPNTGIAGYHKVVEIVKGGGIDA